MAQAARRPMGGQVLLGGCGTEGPSPFPVGPDAGGEDLGVAAAVGVVIADEPAPLGPQLAVPSPVCCLVCGTVPDPFGSELRFVRRAHGPHGAVAGGGTEAAGGPVVGEPVVGVLAGGAVPVADGAVPGDAVVPPGGGRAGGGAGGWGETGWWACWRAVPCLWQTVPCLETLSCRGGAAGRVSPRTGPPQEPAVPCPPPDPARTGPPHPRGSRRP